MGFTEGATRPGCKQGVFNLRSLGWSCIVLSVALFWVIPKGSDAPIVEISVKYWGGLVSGFVGFGLDSVLFFVYAFCFFLPC
ncbi:hypothetical protein, partial [Mobiluncus mulieris]|uniref:hypothetical protein n=1 Tax=Mobiluncus mulieris TaxID=2052 RepID=UPI0021E3259B